MKIVAKESPLYECIKNVNHYRVFENILMNKTGRIITHSGVFHLDDVFCTAFIIYLRNMNEREFDIHESLKTIDILRVSSLSEVQDYQTDKDISFDLLGAHFDHHGESLYRNESECLFVKGLNNLISTGRRDIQYSSFGLLFENFFDYITDVYNEKYEKEGIVYIDGQAYRYEFSKMLNGFKKDLENELVIPIDIVDNNGPVYTNELFDFINSFNTNVENETERMKNFKTAVEIAYHYIERLIERKRTMYKNLYKLVHDDNIHITNNVCYIQINEKISPDHFGSVSFIGIEDSNDCEMYTPMMIVYNTPSERDGSFGIKTLNGYIFDDKLIEYVKEKFKDEVKFIHKNNFLMTFKSFDCIKKLLPEIIETTEYESYDIKLIKLRDN